MCTTDPGIVDRMGQSVAAGHQRILMPVRCRCRDQNGCLIGSSDPDFVAIGDTLSSCRPDVNHASKLHPGFGLVLMAVVVRDRFACHDKACRFPGSAEVCFACKCCG